MAGQPAEPTIAGVVLGERLAVTMYGAVHHASLAGQRELRALVVDPKLLGDAGFRASLTDPRSVATIVRLEHPNIVPTLGVQSGGADAVIVSRGVGRYVTVQDLIATARARGKQAGKLPVPVAALIGKSVIEALAAAHAAGVVHGAIHPRSVLIGEDGAVRVGDFIAGRALTAAIAQGADSALWRGLGGFIAPELVLGERAAPDIDVFAVGALMFAMLSGEAPPGTLRATPAVERLVQRALDTVPARRYRDAKVMLENLVEALEDDRWELADRAELLAEAGLSSASEKIDDATEDLLASLGASSMQVTATPGPAASPPSRPSSDGGRLDEVIAGLRDEPGLTVAADAAAKRRSARAEAGRAGPPKGESSSPFARVPSLDDPDEDAAPPPQPSRGRAPSPDDDERLAPPAQRPAAARPSSADQAAALAALEGLDDPARRMSTAADQAAAAAVKLEQAAARAERMAMRVEDGGPESGTPARRAAPAQRPAAPIVDPIVMDELPVPRLYSPVKRALGALIVLGVIGGGGYLAWTKLQADKAQAEQARLDAERRSAEQQALQAKLAAAQPDAGAIEITAPGAGIWLRLGITPMTTTILLPAGQPHDLVLLRAGSKITEAQVNGTHWKGAKESLKGALDVKLAPATSSEAPVLPLQPTSAVLASTGVVGAGPVRIESSPDGAEVWLFVGANSARFDNLWAGRDYELRVVKPGFKTQVVAFTAEDWRDGGDPRMPIDVAPKKRVLSRAVTLEEAPDAAPPRGRAGSSATKGR